MFFFEKEILEEKNYQIGHLVFVHKVALALMPTDTINVCYGILKQQLKFYHEFRITLCIFIRFLFSVT